MSLTPVQVINYYGPRIYKLLGIDTATSLQIVGISGSLSIVWCALGLYLLDKIGRVKPMIIATTGCGLALLVNSVLSKYYVLPSGATSKDENALRAMVAMNFVFSFFFTMIGIITWVYPAEIFPVQIRARGNSLSTFTNWGLGLIIAQISPIALGDIGFQYFYVFFAFNVIAVACYAFFYPETKGKTLEQMDQLFGDQVVPHALQEPEAAADVMERNFSISQHERKFSVGQHVEEKV